jgi:hypothetical protein
LVAVKVTDPTIPAGLVLRGSWGTRAENFYKVFFREFEIGEFDIEAAV